MAYLGNAPVVGDSTNTFKLLDDIASFTLTFDGSSADVVSVANDTLTFANHRFVTGQRVTYGKGGGTVITGLTDGTAYFIIKVDQSTIKLATNASNAASSTAIDLTGLGAGTSHTLNVAFDGVNTKFKATHSNGTKASVSRAAQLSLSINGVIQQPTEAKPPTVGYGIEADSTIVFSTAPSVADKVFGSFIGEVAPSFDLTDNTVNNFTGDGSTSTFNLSKEIPSNNDVLVTLDGVTQHPSDGSTTRAYSVVGSSLIFVSAPADGVAIQARLIGFAGATTSEVTGFYGRTGNVALKSTDDITFQNANVGVITASKFVGVGSMTNVFVSGITSFTNATDSTSSSTGAVIVSGGVGIAGSLNVGGSVSVGGTLTYEDVTNIDSVGLVTARNGIVVGSGITLSKDGDIFATGITTVSENLMVGDTQTPEKTLHVHGNAIIENTIGNNLTVRSTVNNGNDPNILFEKARGGGTPTIVQNGDDIGNFQWQGYDGNSYEIGASILAEVDGTPSDGDMPMRLTLKTRSAGAGSEQGRLRIHADGLVSLENNSNLQIPDKIIHSGDTNTVIRFPEDDHISFETAGSEAVRIDNGGKLLKGLTDRRLFASGTTSSVQIEGLTAAGTDAASLSIVNNQATINSPSIRFGKTRGTSIGSNTSVADGDQLGQIIFYGADGTDIYNPTALIGALVNGTVGTDTIPTDLVFQTSPTTGSGRNERLRITSDGRVLINSTVARNIGTNINRMLQIESSGGGAGLAAVRNQNNASGPSLDFGKSRGYPNTIVNSGDVLGQIRFAGADGTDLESAAAEIRGEVDGTPGENDMPGRLVFKTTADGASGPTERLRITSDGKMGLGTDDPSNILHISAGGGSCVLELQRNSTNTTGNFGAINFTASDGHSVANMGAYGDGDNEGAYISFKTTSDASSNNPFTSTTEAVRINSDQQLLFKNGSAAKPGLAFISNTDAGFWSNSDNNFYAAIDGTTRYRFNLTFFGPGIDNSYDLGNQSYRWDDVRATNTTINAASDRNEKNTIVPSDLGLDFINKLTPVSFKWNHSKGGVGKRTHYGLISQDIEDLLPKIGKTAMDFGGFLKDEVDDEGNPMTPKYGLRYGEFISPMIKAIQELSAENTALKARVAALEG